MEEGRKTTYGWNEADADKLKALWSSDRFPKPSVTFTPEGVFVCPELARELEEPGNEGLTELLLSMGRQEAAIQRRKLQEVTDYCRRACRNDPSLSRDFCGRRTDL
jgi:hypothetical protein